MMNNKILHHFLLRAVAGLALSLIFALSLEIVAFDALYAQVGRAGGERLLLNLAVAFAVGMLSLGVLEARWMRRQLRPVWRLAVALLPAQLMLLLLNLQPTAVNPKLPLETMLAGELLSKAVTVLLIVLLVGMELAQMMLSGNDGKHRSDAAPPQAATYKRMRPAIFLFLFGIDLSMSFIPLYMENLYEPLFGLPRDVVLGLPISMEFLCVGAAILWSGIWMDRRGWRVPFAWGLLLTAAGGLFSWLATDALQFVMARGVVGIGYGLTLLAGQGFVIRHTDARTKARGLAHLFAGLYAGSICGAATGALLAERFGYAVVFLISTLMVVTVVVYALQTRLLVFGGAGQAAMPSEPADTSAQASQRCTVWHFLGSRQVLAAVFLSSLPASVAAVGFLNYFSPVYLSRQGVTESTIGQILMLFGISLALLGPWIGRLVDQCDNKRWPIAIGSLLGGLAFMLFMGLQGVAAVTLAVLVLGISNCLVLSSQSAYVLQLDVTRRFGDGKAMGIFRATSRVGQMLGPVIFAGLVMATDIEAGIVYFGLAYVLMALVFIAATGKKEAVSLERQSG